jgi:hypothetical protein
LNLIFTLEKAVVSVYFYDLRCPKGKNLSLLRREGVVPIQISKGSDEDNYK